MSIPPETPPVPPRRARRRWLAALVLLGTPALLISGVCVWGTVQANQQQARLDAAIATLHIPDGWTLVKVNRRTPGFAGMCFTGVFDVRKCDKVSRRYSLTDIPTDGAVLEALLPGQKWETSSGNCSAPPLAASGIITYCELATVADGSHVTAALGAYIVSRTMASPYAIVRVTVL